MGRAKKAELNKSRSGPVSGAQKVVFGDVFAIFEPHGNVEYDCATDFHQKSIFEKSVSGGGSPLGPAVGPPLAGDLQWWSPWWQPLVGSRRRFDRSR